jgi:hypothetical protein
MANRNDAATAAIHRHQKTRSASPSPTRQPASHQASPKRTARRSPHTTRTRRHAPPCSARAKNCGAVHTSTRPLTREPSQQANPLPAERLEARAREAFTLAHRRFEASSQAYQDAQVGCRGSSKCPIWVTRCRGPPRIRHGGLWADPHLLRNGPDRSRSRELASGPPDP